MSSPVHPVPPEFAAKARLTAADYQRLYAESVADPEAFWSEVGKRLAWSRPYTRAKDTSFDLRDFHIRWYADGQLNASVNCLDRHLDTHGEKTALIFEPDDPAGEVRKLTYADLRRETIRMANTLKKMGVAKGDRVTPGEALIEIE